MYLSYCRSLIALISLLVSLIFLSWIAPALKAQDEFVLAGQARLLRGRCLILTGEGNFQSGSAMLRERLDLTRSFSIVFGVNFGDMDVEGADGICFVLHNSPSGPAALGNSGGGIGYGWGAGRIGRRIQPSLAVEFDTFNNKEDDTFGDISSDHIAIVRDGRMNQSLAGPIALPNIEDGKCHQIKIDWKANSKTLAVTFDGRQRLSYTADIVSDIFGGATELWWGFTSATGERLNRHSLVLGGNCDECFRAGFTQNDACNPLCLDFQDLSGAASARWLWRFPGARPATSTSRNPTGICYDSAGSYTVTQIVSVGSFSDSISKRVLIEPPPWVNAGRDTSICQGQTAQLNGMISPGLAAWWRRHDGKTPDDRSLRPIVEPDSTAAYILAGRAPNGCEVYDTVVVKVIRKPRLSLVDLTVCAGSQTRLEPLILADGPLRFKWSPSAGLSDTSIGNPLASPLSTTTYTLTAVDSSQCAYRISTSLTVSIVDSIDLRVEDHLTICSGDSVELRARTKISDAEFRWEPREALLDPTAPKTLAWPSETTQYRVHARRGDCEGERFVTVTVHENPVVEAGKDIVLCGTTSTMLAGTLLAGNAETISYTWLPDAGLTDPASLQPRVETRREKMYTLIARDSVTGCVGMDSVFVRLAASVNLDVATPDPICRGEGVQLQASGAQRYRWFPAEGLDDTLSSSPFANPPATTTYTVIGTIGTCIDTMQVTVTVLSLPEVNISESLVYCQHSSQAVLMPVIGADEWLYSWTPADGLDDPLAKTPRAAPSQTTLYTLTVQNKAGCSSEFKVEVIVPPPFAIDAGVDASICAGNSLRLAPVLDDVERFVWTPARGLDDPRALRPLVTPAVSTTYTLTATSATCTQRDSVTIGVDPLPSLSVVDSLFICPGESVQLEADGGNDTYLWTPAEGLDRRDSPTPVASPLRSTEYSVRVRNEYGCSTRATVQVEVERPTTLALSVAAIEGVFEPGDSLSVPLLIAGDDDAFSRTELTALHCSLRYPFATLSYRGGALVKGGEAARDWQFMVREDIESESLLISGRKGPDGAALQAGSLLRLEFMVYFSSDNSLQAAIDFDNQSFAVEQSDADVTTRCITLLGTGSKVHLSTLCLHSARGVQRGFGRYALVQNHPNPVSDSFTITYSLGLDAHTSLRVYDALGAEVLVLIDAFRSAGSYRLAVPTGALPSGAYVYRLVSGPFAAARLMRIAR